MKSIKIPIIIIGIVAFGFIYSCKIAKKQVDTPVVEQTLDLIKITQNGINKSKSDSPPNVLAGQINSLRPHFEFDDINIFRVSSRLPKKYLEYVSEGVYLCLETDKLSVFNKAKEEHISLRIPVQKNKYIELELYKTKIISDNFVVRTSSANESEKINEPGLFYRGIVKGDPQSLAAISVFENSIRGLIADAGGNYVLAQVSDSDENYILYNDKKLKAKQDFDCDVPYSDFSRDSINIDSSNIPKSSHGTHCVEVYIECDFHIYQRTGSTSDLLNYVTSLFNEVSTIYANENILVKVSEIFIWTNTDLYDGLTQASDILNLFRQTRLNNFNGKLAHLISSKGTYGTGVAGRAWVNQLCGKFPFCF